MTKKHSFIETIAEKLGLIPNLHRNREQNLEPLTEEGQLTQFPPMEQWDDWTEYDAEAHPRKVKRNYTIVPTTCFNCESACGLTAYVDKDSQQIRKFEGNPYHPGSRGRNCAKGPATINQITDPDRILYPLKRTGKRGEGKWERVSWDSVLDDIAEGLFQEREIPAEDDSILRNGGLQSNALASRDRSVAIGHPLHQSTQIDLIVVGQPLSGFESSARVQVVKKRAQVVSLLQSRHDRFGAESLARFDSLLQGHEVPLENAQRHHHVVGSVCDVVPKRCLALSERANLGFDRLASAFECGGQLGHLVVAANIDRIVGSLGEALNLFGQMPHSPHDGAGREQRDDEDRDRRESGGSQDRAGKPKGTTPGPDQNDRARSLFPRHPNRDLAPTPVAGSRGGDLLAFESASELGRKGRGSRVAGS